ncbi:MAG: dapE [Rhodocyclaceae bacterium]|nr:MAG: dapE [Rhodocyclaceae bacterium]TND05612.1 MAG: dapE [Rhodocyclaceae bacterium]
MTDAVALTQTLVRMNTINPPGDEDQCCDYLAGLLSAAGFSCARYEFAPRRTSLVARIGDGSGGKAPLCFTGHVDVVPLGAAPWSRDAFAAEIVDGKLYGRGSSDMKSGVAAFVAAALDLADKLKKGPGLVLVITAGEETGCEGAFDLARRHEVEGILGSAGAIVVAEPTANYPLVGHKGAFWLKASTAGITAHGSMPECGDNAIYKAARAVSALERFEFEAAPHPLMGRATLNVGNIRGGLNINSVPDAAEIGIDIRTIPGIRHSDLYGCLCRHLGETVRLDTLLDVESVYTDPADPWMQSVFAVMVPILGEVPVARSVSYFTDAAALTRVYGGPPTVILGPGEPQLAHQTDEYCHVHRIEQAVLAFRQIITEWYMP